MEVKKYEFTDLNKTVTFRRHSAPIFAFMKAKINHLFSVKLPWFVQTVGLLYLFLFVYTAYAKFVDHEQFFKVLSKSPLLSDGVVWWVSWGVPVIETVLALFLLIPGTLRKALYPAMMLMAAFTVYLIVMLLSGLPRTCSCGGIIAAMSWEQHIAFNLGFIILALAAMKPEAAKRIANNMAGRARRCLAAGRIGRRATGGMLRKYKRTVSGSVRSGNIN